MRSIVNAYVKDENGDNNRLNQWLRYREWKCKEAAQIFVDIDPDSVKQNGLLAETFRGVQIVHLDHNNNPVVYWTTDDGHDVCEGIYELDQLFLRWSDLQRILAEKDEASPKEWIDIATSKNIDIPWLVWAQNRGLIGQAEPTSKDRSHVSNKLTMVNRAAKLFWANADQADGGTQPKNDEVVKWLVKEGGLSRSLADKAATIIRPEWAFVGRKSD